MRIVNQQGSIGPASPERGPPGTGDGAGNTHEGRRHALPGRALLERRRFTPAVIALKHPDLSAQKLCQDLCEGIDITECSDVDGLQKKPALVLAVDRGREQLALEASQLEGCGDGSVLTHVEHDRDATRRSTEISGGLVTVQEARMSGR